MINLANIDWITLMWGVAIALIIFNLTSLISAYIKRNKARRELKAADARIEAFKQDLIKKKDILKKQAAEIQKEIK